MPRRPLNNRRQGHSASRTVRASSAIRYARLQTEPLEDRTLLNGTDLTSQFSMLTSVPDGSNELFQSMTLPLSGSDESSLPGNGGFPEVGTAEFEITPGRIELAAEVELSPNDTTTERDNGEVSLHGRYNDEYEIVVPANRSLDGRTATMDVTFRISGGISLGQNDPRAYTTARLDVRAPFTSNLGLIVQDGITILNGEERTEGSPVYPKTITASVQFVLGQHNTVAFEISTGVGASLEIGAPPAQYGAATDFTLQWLGASNLQVVNGPALAISDVLIASASGFNYLTGGADDELPTHDEFHWTNATGGSFDDADNWDVGEVPGDNAAVFFAFPAEYTVDVGSQTVERAVIGGNPATDVTFSNTNLLVQSTAPSQPSVEVDNGAFTLADGTLTSNHASIGPAASTEAFLLGGARWFNNGRFTVGSGGEANFTIGNGTLTSGETRIGDATNGAEGAVVVQGLNSRLNAGTLGVGMQGRGTLTIEQGASATAEAVVVANSPTGSGQISIIGSHPLTGAASRFDVTGSVSVGAGGTIDAPRSGGEGELLVIGGAVVDVEDIVHVGNTGKGRLAVSGVHADSGLPSVLSSDFMFIGFVSEGAMTVSSGASVLTAGGALVGNNGKVTVQDGGSSWLLQGDLDLEEEGLLEVHHGGLVSAPNLSSNHIVDIQGQGADRASTLRVANLLSVGGEGGTPLLVVDDGAVVEAGAIDLGAFDPGVPVGVIIDGIGANGLPSTLRETSANVPDTVFDVVVGNHSPTSVFVLQGGLFEASGQIVIGASDIGGVSVEGLDGPTGFRSTLQADNIYLGLGPVQSDLSVINGALALARSAVIDTHGDAEISGGQNGVLSHWSLDEELAFEGGALTVENNGTVTIGAASPHANRVVVGPGGTLRGSGTINLDPLPGNAAVVNAGGVIDVGNSPGTISVFGDLILDDGDLQIEIAGPTPGSEFDQLVVTGNVQLGGTLKLVFLDGFVPQPGQTFDFLDAASVVGAFANVVVEGLPAGLDVSFDPISGILAIEGEPVLEPQFTVSAINGPDVGVPGQLRSYFVTFSDTGTGDSYTATIDWGDGTVDSGFVATTESGGNTTGVVSFWHTYTTIGDRTIELTLRDGQGNVQTAETDITVQLITFQSDPLDMARRALVVGGLEGVNDAITFVPAAGGAHVLFNGYDHGQFTFDGSVLAFGQSGDDVIVVNPTLTRSAMLFGQAGNDQLFGGSGSNILVGGTGADRLFGAGLRDLLFGGLGADTLEGREGDDLLASDFTVHEYDPALLAMLFRRWTSSDSYSDRLHNLRFEESPALNNTTVFNDFEVDQLTGGGGQDWFLFLASDLVTGSEAGEEALGATF